jgi:hypothetical protein
MAARARWQISQSSQNALERNIFHIPDVGKSNLTGKGILDELLL